MQLIEYLESEIHKKDVDIELLLDYVTYMELKYEGKLTNGRLPYFDDEMNEGG